MASDIQALRVEKLSSHGEGIAFSNGKAIFIPYTIPEETVSVEVVEDHSSFSRARLLKVEEASPHRVEAPCPLFGICGGCALQHIEYSAQKSFKQRAAQEAFARIGGFDAGELPIVAGEPYGYRNRTQVHATKDGALGFTQANSRDVVKTPRCPTLVPVLNRWLSSENRKANPYRALSALIGDRPRFTAFGQDEHIYIEGRDAYARAAVAGKDFQFPTGHFFQSNLGVLEMLIERELGPIRAAGRGEIGNEIDKISEAGRPHEADGIASGHGNYVLDLYSGAGLFSLFLADRFEAIECVESEAASVEAARMNLRGSSARIHFSDIPVERWIRTPRATYRFDTIVTDPPRTGLSPDVRSWLGSAKADTLVYVSCDHASLARDLKELKNRGWSIETIALYDFYPQTGRLEAVARLVRDAQ